MATTNLRELALHPTQHLVAAHPSAFILSFRQLIAVANQLLEAVLAPLVGEVSTLDASHFDVAEPVRYLIHLQLVLQLRKELCVVDGSLSASSSASCTWVIACNAEVSFRKAFSIYNNRCNCKSFAKLLPEPPQNQNFPAFQTSFRRKSGNNCHLSGNEQGNFRDNCYICVSIIMRTLL